MLQYQSACGVVLIPMHEWWNHSYMHKLLQHLTMSSSLSEISCIDLAVAINLHANGAFVNYLEVAVKINTLCYIFLVRFLALCVGILKFCTSHETIYSTWVVIYLGHTHNMRTRGLIFLPCVDDRPAVPAASQTWLDHPSTSRRSGRKRIQPLCFGPFAGILWKATWHVR